MKQPDKHTRHKRFQIDEKHKVTLLVETNMGNRYELCVTDCSLSGVAGKLVLKPGENLPVDLEVNSILPAAKVQIDKLEFSLGRTVLRTVRLAKDAYLIGFSMIDGQMPLSGPLSKYLQNPFFDNNNPYDFELSPESFSLANFVGENNNVDLFARFNQFNFFLKEWKRSKQYSYSTTRTESMGSRVSLTRTRKNGRKDYLVFGSNDYLGLASHPEVVHAVEEAVKKYGFGSTGSSVTTGLTDLHFALTDKIAKLFKKEKALLYNSGFITNVGIINSILTSQDFVACDVIAHASIQDALKMSPAKSRFFIHNDSKHLDKLLHENRANHAGSLVITEGIFSMEGDVPPLDEIYQVARKHNSRLMVDEAHSFGVVGPTGLGACEKFGLLGEVDIIMGTFSKVCGGIGGFVAGSEALIDWLHHTSRSYIFSVALPPSTVAGVLKALTIFEKQHELVSNLQKNIKHFVRGVRELGFRGLSENHESSIVPIEIGDELKLGIMNESLLDDGIFVTPIVFPAVSKKRSRFRFTITAQHSLADLDLALMALKEAMRKANFNPHEQNAKEQTAQGNQLAHKAS